MSYYIHLKYGVFVGTLISCLPVNNLKISPTVLYKKIVSRATGWDKTVSR